MKRTAGLTLIELMVVIGVMVILAAIAIPAYKHMTSSNRVTGAVNALASTLAYARSEAIARGEQVAVCPSANAATGSPPSCDTGGGGWQEGWIVYVGTGIYDGDSANLIRVHGPLGTISIPDSSAHNYIAFDRMGFARPTFSAGETSLKIVACPPDNRAAHARAVILYLSGAVKTATRRPDSGDPFSC